MLTKSAANLGMGLVRLPINLNFHADWDARTASTEIRSSCKQWLLNIGFAWLMPELTNMVGPCWQLDNKDHALWFRQFNLLLHHLAL